MAGTDRTTELQALNILLASIGSAPLNSLPGLGGNDTADGVLAQSTLDEVRKTVLSEGYHFNRDEEYELVPNPTDFKVYIPNNVLRIDGSTGKNGTKDLTEAYDLSSGQALLYDREERSFDFSDVEKVYVDITWNREFHQIPEDARRYITIRAARLFVGRLLGPNARQPYTEQEEVLAKIALEKQDASVADRSIFAHWDVARILDR